MGVFSAGPPYRRANKTDMPPCPVTLRRCGLYAEENGSTLIEVALSVLIIATLALGIFEVSSMLYTYNVLGDAAREGLRYAVVHGTDSGLCSGPSSGCGDTSGANIVTVVHNYAVVSFHDVRTMNVTPSWPDGTSTPGSRVKVQITYTYHPYVHFPGLSPQMNLSAEGRIAF